VGWQTTYVDELGAGANGVRGGRKSPKAVVGKIAVVLALMGCFAGMGWAFTMNKTPELPGGTEVEGVVPVYGATAVPGQTPVEVDLAFGFTGEILIDDRPLPVDQPRAGQRIQPVHQRYAHRTGPLLAAR
jgi:hypothetical protein